MLTNIGLIGLIPLLLVVVFICFLVSMIVESRRTNRDISKKLDRVLQILEEEKKA